MCSKLTNVFIGENVKKIGYAAFEKTSISILTIPDNVETIGEGAFRSCAAMTKVTIGSHVSLIEEDAFVDCTKLNTFIFKIPTGWTRIDADYNVKEIPEDRLAYFLDLGHRIERS